MSRDLAELSEAVYLASEGIAVALAGEKLGNPVSAAISDLAQAINNHADAVSAVAEAIRERKGA